MAKIKYKKGKCEHKIFYLKKTAKVFMLKRENILSEKDLYLLTTGVIKLIRKNVSIDIEKKYKREKDMLLNRLEIMLRENNRLKKELAKEKSLV